MEDELRGMHTTLSDIQSRLAVPIPSDPTLLPIRTEADAAIGADGRKLSNYIDENTNTVSKPLFPDSWTDGYHGEPSLSFAPSESDLTESEYEDFPDSEDDYLLEEKQSEPELGEPSRMEGQASDDEYVDMFPDAEPELGVLTNFDELVDAVEADGGPRSMSAEPFEVAADRMIPSLDHGFDIMHPKTWHRLFRRGGTNSNNPSEPLPGHRDDVAVACRA